MPVVLLSGYASLIIAAFYAGGDYGWAVFFFGNFLSSLTWLSVYAKD